MSEHVVVLGCPRSGTSILGELFEVAGFNFWFEEEMSTLRAGVQGRCAFKNPVDLQGGDRDRAIEVRTPGLACDIDELDEILDGPRYIWVVRHPLDVVASLLPGMREPGWMHGPAPPNWKELHEPVERSVAMWLWLNEVGAEQLRQRHDNVLLVRYEDLLRSTEETARRVLAHADVVDDTTVATYVERVSDSPKGYQARYQDRWLQTNHSVHIGRWRWELTEHQAEVVWKDTERTAGRFGYGIFP